MSQIFETSIPIFSVVGLGFFAGRMGFLPPGFLEPANRLVFYIAIPAMVFKAISRASFDSQFNPQVLWVVILSLVLVYAATWAVCIFFKISMGKRATFIQGSTHGNLGYVGLAVAYYYMGEHGLASAGILAGFLMISQNFLSVVALEFHAEKMQKDSRKRAAVWKIIGNPVILSAMAGIVYSISGLDVPVILERTLAIIGGLALPMALFIIGATLSVDLIKDRFKVVFWISVFKLFILPGTGYILYRFLGIAGSAYLPGLILLASPTATVSLVMAKEMKADADMAAAVISATTLLSAFSMSLWLKSAGW